MDENNYEVLRALGIYGCTLGEFHEGSKHGTDGFLRASVDHNVCIIGKNPIPTIPRVLTNFLDLKEYEDFDSQDLKDYLGRIYSNSMLDMFSLDSKTPENVSSINSRWGKRALVSYDSQGKVIGSPQVVGFEEGVVPNQGRILLSPLEAEIEMSQVNTKNLAYSLDDKRLFVYESGFFF